MYKMLMVTLIYICNQNKYSLPPPATASLEDIFLLNLIPSLANLRALVTKCIKLPKKKAFSIFAHKLCLLLLNTIIGQIPVINIRILHLPFYLNGTVTS